MGANNAYVEFFPVRKIIIFFIPSDLLMDFLTQKDYRVVNSEIVKKFYPTIILYYRKKFSSKTVPTRTNFCQFNFEFELNKLNLKLTQINAKIHSTRETFIM